MPIWFYELPIYLALVVIFIVCNLISLLGYWCYKKYLIKVDSKDIVTKVVWQTVLFFSTIFITFWIVTNWSNLGSLRQTSIKEANTLVLLYNDLDGIPKENSVLLEQRLNKYLDLVIHQEYQTLAHGQEDLATSNSYHDLVLAVYTYVPSSNLASELRYNRILEHLSAVSDYRENRLSYLDGNLTGSMLLFFLTMVIIGCFWTGFIDTKSLKFTLFIIMSQNLIISSSTWLILEMDKPFQGEFSVTNAPFVAAQKEIHLLQNFIIHP